MTPTPRIQLAQLGASAGCRLIRRRRAQDFEMPGESTQLLDTLAKSTCGSCGITCEPGTQDISLCAARDISEIHINAGDLVDRIEIRYRDGTSAIHGAKGGHKMKPFLFKPGEKLVRISVRQGDSLDGCQFYLDSGRCSEWYGGRGGRSGWTRPVWTTRR